jgi:hypothetical protein
MLYRTDKDAAAVRRSRPGGAKDEYVIRFRGTGGEGDLLRIRV